MTEKHRKLYCVLKMPVCLVISGMLVSQVSFAKAGENNVTGDDQSGSATGRASLQTNASALKPPVQTQVQIGKQTSTNTNASSQLNVIVTPAIGYAWVGDKVTLTAVAIGPQPLGYQWYCDGQMIAGATQAKFELADVQLTNAGTYTVMVTNANGFDMGTSCLNVDSPTSPQVILATNGHIAN